MTSVLSDNEGNLDPREEVIQLKALIKKLEIQNEQLRRSQSVPQNLHQIHHAWTATEESIDFGDGYYPLNDRTNLFNKKSTRKHANCDISLETVDVIDLEHDNLLHDRETKPKLSEDHIYPEVLGNEDFQDNDDDQWLFESPKPLTPQQKSVNTYKWLRRDYDENPSPELLQSRRLLVYKLDEVVRRSPFSSPDVDYQSHSYSSSKRHSSQEHLSNGYEGDKVLTSKLPPSKSIDCLASHQKPSANWRKSPKRVEFEQSSSTDDERMSKFTSDESSEERRCGRDNFSAGVYSSNEGKGMTASSSMPVIKRPLGLDLNAPGKHIDTRTFTRPHKKNRGTLPCPDDEPVRTITDVHNRMSSIQALAKLQEESLRKSITETRRGSAGSGGSPYNSRQGSPAPQSQPPNKNAVKIMQSSKNYQKHSMPNSSKPHTMNNRVNIPRSKSTDSKLHLLHNMEKPVYKRTNYPQQNYQIPQQRMPQSKSTPAKKALLANPPAKRDGSVRPTGKSSTPIGTPVLTSTRKTSLPGSCPTPNSRPRKTSLPRGSRNKSLPLKPAASQGDGLDDSFF